jgi:hypothetical protein
MFGQFSKVEFSRFFPWLLTTSPRNGNETNGAKKKLKSVPLAAKNKHHSRYDADFWKIDAKNCSKRLQHSKQLSASALKDSDDTGVCSPGSYGVPIFLRGTFSRTPVPSSSGYQNE